MKLNITDRQLWTVILLLVAASSLPVYAQDSTIARLFYTPQERARLDQIRHSGIETTRPLPAGTDSTAKTVTLNGIIKKRNGGLRAWINGKTLDSGKVGVPVRVGRQLTERQQLPLRLPGGLTARPKVGQIVDLTTGQLHEGYQPPVEPVVVSEKPTVTSPETNTDEPIAD